MKERITDLDPTESHKLWDGAVEVHCFGTRHGDWSMRGKTPEEAEKNNPDILDRMRRVAEQLDCTIFAPNPSTFNGRVVPLAGFRDGWIRGRLLRGEFADGVLLSRPRQAFAVSSGDCPTVILRDELSGRVVAAHAGRDSLIKTDGGLVPRMLGILREHRHGARLPAAFIACGIGREHFTHPWNDPQDGERNRRLHAFACRYMAAEESDQEGRIHLPLLIQSLLMENDVDYDRISWDGTDTYRYRGPDGAPLWHSHRRDRNGKRNLVLVIWRW